MEITHHHHSLSNKLLEEPTTPPVVVEEIEKVELKTKMEEITHHHHSSLNKLEEPATTPLVVVVEEIEKEELKTTTKMEEITHDHHSSSNKLEEPTTTPLVLVVEEIEKEDLKTTTTKMEEITHDHHSSSNKLEEPTTKTTTTPLVLEKEEEVVTDVDDSVVAEMEKILNYRFRNKNLLNEALAQCIRPKRHNNSTASLSERLQFQRLEYLGDVALGLAVASFIIINCPNITPRSFSEIHTNNVSTEKFARVALKHGFDRYLRRKFPASNDSNVREFALVVQDERNGFVSSEAKKAPKFLADIVESIAAAIYVDSDFDLKLLWKCFAGLLEPCVAPTSKIVKLLQHCKKAGKQAHVRYGRQGSQNIATVYVNGHFVCSSYSEEESVAISNAATEALKLLSSTSFPVDVDVAAASVTGNDVPEIDSPTEKMEELFHKTYKVEKEDSEGKAIKEKLEKKRKRETGSEVSAEKVKRDMAIDEKLEKKSNTLVGAKKRKLENGSEVSADKVKVDIAINEKLEKKTKKENGGDVSAEKVEQLFAEENSSMKKITYQSNAQGNSKKYAPIYTSKHMHTSLSSVAEVEEILSYRFRNKSLLEEAFTHSPYTSSAPNNERRPGFLGRNVLSLAVSNFLFIMYPDLQPYQLNQLQNANLYNEKLACVAIRHGFNRYLRCNCPVLDAEVRDFALMVQEEGDGVAYGGVSRTPIILAEIVKSIAAAIFVDCEFDFKLLWKYFCGLLEPLVTLDTYQQPSLSMLRTLCRRERKLIDFKHSYESRQFTVSCNVNGQLVGSGCSESKYVATVTAAREALKLWNLDSLPMDAVVDLGSATVNDVPGL